MLHWVTEHEESNKPCELIGTNGNQFHICCQILNPFQKKVDTLKAASGNYESNCFKTGGHK
jgi:hypothetical protein